MSKQYHIQPPYACQDGRIMNLNYYNPEYDKNKYAYKPSKNKTEGSGIGVILFILLFFPVCMFLTKWGILPSP